MFFEYNNICYKIWFRHVTGIVTDCYIGIRNDSINRGFVYEGSANCNPADRFVKETGRKLSLERACKQANDKAFTKAAFDCYLNRKKQ